MFCEKYNIPLHQGANCLIIEAKNGSITIIGLSKDWQLLIDESLVHIPNLVIGGGLRRSKLLIPGKALTELPNVSILQGLTTPLL